MWCHEGRYGPRSIETYLVLRRPQSFRVVVASNLKIHANPKLGRWSQIQALKSGQGGETDIDPFVHSYVRVHARTVPIH